MRIWFMSDIHPNPEWPFELPEQAPAAEVIVLAGDCGEEMSRRAIPWVAENFKIYGLPIIYVPGNHDFYRAHLSHEVTKARLVADHHGVTLLAQGESVVIDGVRFVGATMWTDYALGDYGHIAELEALKSMNDFRYIRHGSSYSKARPKEIIDIHYEQRFRIEKVLATPFDGPTVVITHHAPLEASLQHGKREHPLDPAYASDLSGLIEKYAPELWIHGHIHVNRDYVHDRTRVACNPRGYLLGNTMRGRGRTYPENEAFDPELVITVTKRG